MVTVVFTCFGSAGDLFPLVPVAQAVERHGHRVIVVVPRSLGGLLRGTSLPTRVFGVGQELAILRDPDLRSTRRDGWASWEHLLDGWIAPSLPQEVDAFERILDDIRPDLVVTSALAIAARIAARRQGRPTVCISIFPQWAAPPKGAAPRSHETVAHLVGYDAEDVVDGILWGGLDAEILLYDQRLLDGWRPERDAIEIVGFPYWDGLTEPGETVAVSDRPRVLVSFGSYFGPLVADRLQQVVDALLAFPVEVVVAGPRPRDTVRIGFEAAGPRVRFVGFTPVSQYLPSCSAVVHHGGVGSMFGALRQGLPALVVPQAFDQPFNAQLVARHGVGLDARSWTIEDGVAALLADNRQREAAVALAVDLVPGHVAAETAAKTVCEAL